MSKFCLMSVVVALAAISGCQRADQAASAGDPQYRLTSEPAGARGVAAARKEAQAGQAVVVVGRIGGDARPWVEGRAAFVIADTALKPCNERAGDTCETPWDYCCDLDVLKDSKAMVQVVDAHGQPIAQDARRLLGVKELQTVVVRGTARRDDAGNLTIDATGLYVK